MNILIDVLLIALMTVFVIDISGFIDSVEKTLNRWLGTKTVHIPKPFSCSLCSTFWAGLLYLLITNNFTIIYMAYVCLMALLTPVYNNVLLMVRDAMIWIINNIYKIID